VLEAAHDDQAAEAMAQKMHLRRIDALDQRAQCRDDLQHRFVYRAVPEHIRVIAVHARKTAAQQRRFDAGHPQPVHIDDGRRAVARAH
jgi:hypothetical protein